MLTGPVLVRVSFVVFSCASAALAQWPEKLERVDEAGTLLVFEGFVYTPDGSPAEGALVVTSSGGKAVVDVRGHYRIEARVPEEAQLVQVTAFGSKGRNLAASASVGVSATTGSVVVDPLSLVQGSTCSPSWLPTFGGGPGTNGTVYALAAYDDGGGPALYAGGNFTFAGGVMVSNIARWDGSSWTTVEGGMNNTVQALAVYDDGGGPALYAGGGFTRAGGGAAKRIARWDGSSWSALGSGMNDYVSALAVYDDGSGPALYAGGVFTTAGDGAANRIARWDGSSWSALGSGMIGTFYEVRALAVFDDSGGPTQCSALACGTRPALTRSALYAGGDFTNAGGVAAHNIARWDGSSWSALKGGTSRPFSSGRVEALTVYDDGGGQALYAGGEFTTAGGVAANLIARWDGSSWSALGSGMGGDHPGIGVQALSVYDDGSGPALYAGGDFTRAGGGAANNVARWDGSSWSALGSGIGVGLSGVNVFALAVYDDGCGPALYAGANITTRGGSAASNIFRWDSSSWSGVGSGLRGSVLALTVYDDGGGPALYASGGTASIARWDGSSWSALGSGIGGSVLALAVYDDGSRPALYAGGRFTTAGGVAANNIARWDGSRWRALSSGLNNTVQALAVYDGGGGPALYAGGEFTSAGGVVASGIARWNGSSWSKLGSGMNAGVAALAVYDDGRGPALYAGGGFSTAVASGIARWDGSSWSALGSGMSGLVLALAVYDDGGGPALYAGGSFTTAGGVAANRIARWDGGDPMLVDPSWSALGSGMDFAVHALAVYDDGGGPALYAGGAFRTAGGGAASRIARWNGSSWSTLGSGMNDRVLALAVYDDGGGPALYAGGEFTSALDSHDSFLAKWGCPDTIPPVLECPASITVLDGLGNGPGEVVTFTVIATDDQDRSPDIVSTPLSGSFFPLGTTVVTCTATDASGNESTCQFPVEVRTKLHRRR